MYNPESVNLSKVVGKLLVLGGVFSINVFFLFTKKNIPLNLYLIFWSIFHTLEFLTTAVYNNSVVDDDSFILEDKEVHFMNSAAILEYLLKGWFGWQEQRAWVTLVGLVVLLAGQFIRTLAMCTAKESFNHHIQRSQSQNHKLVTTGIYGYFRHPSYFGFWWWFVGMQLVLNSVFVMVVGCGVLWRFFSRRIEFEEGFLVEFFKEEYVGYRRRTLVWIPFIR